MFWLGVENLKEFWTIWQKIKYKLLMTVVYGIEPNWYQIWKKICYIPNVSKFYVEKEYLC